MAPKRGRHDKGKGVSAFEGYDRAKFVSYGATLYFEKLKSE